MATKRINLSFNDSIEKDAYIYNVINSKKHKTEFIIQAVTYYLNNSKVERPNNDYIKDALREVLLEYDFEGVRVGEKEKSKHEIPDMVFDMFNSL